MVKANCIRDKISTSMAFNELSCPCWNSGLNVSTQWNRWSKLRF